MSKFDPSHEMNFIVHNLSKNVDNIYNLIYRVFHEKSNDKFKSVRTQLHVLIAIELFITTVMSTFTSLLFNKLKDSITDIIQTTQPPFIQYISSQFDKLLSFDKYQNVEINSYAYVEVTIPYILIFAVILIYPIAILCKPPHFSKFQFKQKQLLPAINCTKAMQFLYFSLARYEYSTISSRNTPTSSYKSTTLLIQMKK